MANVFDYLDWRGDLTLDLVPLCDVDALVLSRLSYLPLDGLVPPEGATVGALMRQLLAAQPPLLLPEDGRFIPALAASQRFCEMRIMDYVNQIDLESQTQFAAITVALGDGRHFVAFRGTDGTLVGWKEDFNMAFTCPVPAQRLAARYAASAMLRFPGEFLLGGHSKGGNLAVYAAAFCPAALQERIAAVYNNDGPGFDADVIALPGYQRICARVQTFVPQSSIVGMLLEHEEAYTIIHSTGDGFGQHNLYTWEVLRDRFVTLETVTNGSRFLDRTLKQWLAGLEPEQRERTIDTVYHMLCETNAETLHELKENRFSRALALLRSAKGLDEDTRKLLVNAAGLFFRSAGRSIKQARVPAEQQTSKNDRGGMKIIPPRFFVGGSLARCRGGDSRAQLRTCSPCRPPLRRHAPPTCHSEERSDVGISCRHLQPVQGNDKTYQPIASVAALIERLVGDNSTAEGHWCTTAPA